MLRADNRRPMTLLTPYGWLTYMRYALRPADKTSKANLQAMGKKSIYPMDEHLGVSDLPFRVTCEMALLIAQKCINADSYEEVAKDLSETYGKRNSGDSSGCLSDDTVRRITDYVGNIVLNAENQFVEDMTES